MKIRFSPGAWYLYREKKRNGFKSNSASNRCGFECRPVAQTKEHPACKGGEG